MSDPSNSPGSPPSLAPDTGGPSHTTGDTTSTSSEDPLASGIRALLDPTIQSTTEKLLKVHQSQMALSEELDRLIAQLTKYLDTTDVPALKPTIVKLASLGKRLAAVNKALDSIQARVNKLYVQLSKQRAVP